MLRLMLSAFAVLLTACTHGAASAPPVRPESAELCYAASPRPEYVPTGFGRLAFSLPPEYRPIEPPDVLISAAIWTAPDSSVFSVGTNDASFHFDETEAVIEPEGECVLDVAGTATIVVLHRAASRASGDSAFAGRLAVRLAGSEPLTVVFLGRTRSTRAALMGVLATVAVRR